MYLLQPGVQVQLSDGNGGMVPEWDDQQGKITRRVEAVPDTVLWPVTGSILTEFLSPSATVVCHNYQSNGGYLNENKKVQQLLQVRGLFIFPGQSE